MTDANMICPGCKTFQPRAETCVKCGAIVAKLWAQQSPPEPPREQKASAQDSKHPALFAGGSALVVAVIAYGLWTMLSTESTDNEPGSPGVRSYLEAARDAQYAAESARERMEAAAYEAETGIVGLSPHGFSAADEVDLDLDRLAAEINAVSQVSQVDVTASDVQRVVRQCARFPERYFKPLRFGAAESYPLPEPETEPYQAGSIKGTYRCEGGEGVVYTHSVLRTQDDLTACWEKQDPPRGQIPRDRSKKRETLWVKMKWDPEAQSWAIYSRADQRAVDETRLPEAKGRDETDIKRIHGRRVDRARDRIPKLVTTIEALQEQLSIAASEELQRKYSKSLSGAEQKLRKALVERRYLWICNSAASAALDALEQRLSQ